MGLSDPGRPFRFEANGSPFAADFNGDGKADVVISGPPATLLFTGNGDGTFSPPIIIAGCSSVSAVADFNGDGKADLICGPTALFFYNTVFLSNGDGTFRASGTVGTFAQAVVTLTADFNNDGNPDVLLRELSGQFAVVLGHGDGTFGAELLITSSTETGELATFPVAAGDFNGDGKIDLVGYSYRGFFIDVLPGNGEGTFGTAVQTNIGANPQPGLVFATGDFNKDGKLDLVAGEAIFAGNGDGTFRFPVFFGSVVLPCVTVTATIPCGYQYVATAVADFNGDGLPDIAAGTVAQGLNSKTVAAISVLLNDSPWDGFTATGVSSATLTWPVGAGSLVSAFGVNLAPATEAASVNPAPTTLGGIRLHVRDRSHTGDSLAPLLYVSPTQINYLLTSSDPYAWVSVERVGSPYVPKGMSVPIVPIAPGLFSVGTGLAAASALAVTPYAETFVPVTSCNGQTCTSVPIDLSGAPVYLSLYGTGFAQASTVGSGCVIAGQALPATYAGPEIQIAGLDQVNLLLPQSLAGTGPASVVCSFQNNGLVQGSTNAVNLTIR
jgi:uncharacterized protein (TIGR03437 family)